MTGPVPPAALLYDRSAAPTTGLMRARLAECRAHANDRGWPVIGEWHDTGPVALTPDTRPELDDALSLVSRLLDRRHPAVMLVVHGRDRLSSASFQAGLWQARIEQAGAQLHVVFHDTRGHACTPLPTAHGAQR